jgi:hypothetical protein
MQSPGCVGIEIPYDYPNFTEKHVHDVLAEVADGATYPAPASDSYNLYRYAEDITKEQAELFGLKPMYDMFEPIPDEVFGPGRLAMGWAENPIPGAGGKMYVGELVMRVSSWGQ